MSSIRVSWLTDEQTKLLLVTYPPQWVWEEQTQASATITHYLNHATDPTPIIFDVTAMQTLPPDIFGRFTEVGRSPLYNHPNAGPLYVVGAEGLTLTTITLYKRLFPQHGSRLHLIACFEDLPYKKPVETITVP